MLLADVNVFIYSHRPESPQADEHREWLSRALVADEPFGVSDAVLSSFIRIVTHHRVYREPTPTDVALRFAEAVRSARSAVPVRPGPRHWDVFARLSREVGARGNVVPDAYLAALAIEAGATWITTDYGFARFPGLRWRTPLAGS